MPMRTPEELRQRLQSYWQNRRRRWLLGEGEWPLSLGTEPPGLAQRDPTMPLEDVGLPPDQVRGNPTYGGCAWGGDIGHHARCSTGDAHE